MKNMYIQCSFSLLRCWPYDNSSLYCCFSVSLALFRPKRLIGVSYAASERSARAITDVRYIGAVFRPDFKHKRRDLSLNLSWRMD